MDGGYSGFEETGEDLSKTEIVFIGQENSRKGFFGVKEQRLLL